MSAGALAARRPPLSIDISCPRGAQQQTSRPPLVLSIDGTDGRTDGLSDTEPLHRRLSHTERAVTINYYRVPDGNSVRQTLLTSLLTFAHKSGDTHTKLYQ